MKKKSRISIIIIIIIVLVCIGCAILSGTPYFKNKMAKLTQKEHFEDLSASDWMKEKLANIKAGNTGQGTACLGGPTGSYLQGPGGVKDCYTLEGKKNSVPENFFKKPIFFDNTSLYLQNNLDNDNQLHTSITNTQGKLNFKLNQNQSESNFDIVRSPKLTPESYTPSYTTQPKFKTIEKTKKYTGYGLKYEDRINIVKTKGKQECDGSIKSIVNSIVTTVKKAFQVETSQTTSSTQQIDDTSKEWRPPQPFKLPQNVGNDNFPAKDESSDKLVHRFGSDGSSISTGAIRTLGGVKFNNNSSITQDSNKNLEIYADNQISFSAGPTNQPIKTVVNDYKIYSWHSVPTIHLGTKSGAKKNYLTKDDVRNLNKIIDGSEPLILNKLRCGDITTPSIESDMFSGQNIVSGELNVFKDQNLVDPIQFRATQNDSIYHKNYMVMTNNNSNTQIKSTANLTFGGHFPNSYIKLNDNDSVKSLTADIINGQKSCAIENKYSKKFLHINYDNNETGWKPFTTRQPLFHNAAYEIKLVKKIVTKSGAETVTLYSGTSGNSPYMRRTHKKLIPIITLENLNYYLVDMGIFSQSDIRRLSFMDKIQKGKLSTNIPRIDIAVYYRKVSHNYETDMLGNNKTPFYINVAQGKASSPPT